MGRAIVAIILALTVAGFITGMFVVRVLMPPEVMPSTELLKMFADLLAILIGGLMVWLGMDKIRDKDE